MKPGERRYDLPQRIRLPGRPSQRGQVHAHERDGRAQGRDHVRPSPNHPTRAPRASVREGDWLLTAEQGAGRRNRIGTVLAQPVVADDAEDEVQKADAKGADAKGAKAKGAKAKNADVKGPDVKGPDVTRADDE